jgi:hypothetical protein
MNLVTLRARTAPATLEGIEATVGNNGDRGRRFVGYNVHHLHLKKASSGDLTWMTPSAKGTLLDPDHQAQYYESSLLPYLGGGRSLRPSMDFQSYSREPLKSWRNQCEWYFRVFDIHPEFWFGRNNALC